jgi:myo-inositol-1(or 4)-monophosphatase
MELTQTERNFIEKFTHLVVPALESEAEIIARSYFEQDFSPEIKLGDDPRDHLDLVTRLDKEVEERMYDLLHKNFPALGFSLEEHKSWQKHSPEFNCFLDPVDGTKYFAKQVPLFSTQVGLSFKGEPVFGLVINPLTKEIYMGSELIPSQRNGRKISVSKINNLSEAMLNVGIVPYRPNWDQEKEWIFSKLLKLENNTYRVRKIGSSALILSWVAQGALDGALYLVADPDYDTIAGQALVKYAGGKAEKVEIPGIKQPRLICSNSALFDQIRDLLLS